MSCRHTFSTYIQNLFLENVNICLASIYTVSILIILGTLTTQLLSQTVKKIFKTLSVKLKKKVAKLAYK